jgi:energy-coupling factor transporter transmembrane protein EcfT
MLFRAKKDYTFLIVFLFVLLLYSGISLFTIIYEDDYSVIWVFLIVLTFLALLFISIYKTTYFRLDQHNLFCKSLIFKKEIPYSSIKKVEKQQGIYAGVKFSTAWKGIIVHYNKYDELLISPENEEIFIVKIQERIEGSKTL